MIVQLSDATLVSILIAEISVKLSKLNFKVLIWQLLFSLAIYASPPLSFPESFSVDELHPSVVTLRNYLENRTRSLDFVQHIVYTVPHDPIDMPFSVRAIKANLFSSINSPHPAIRACAKLAIQFPAFREELFPVGFLSCWNTETLKCRQQFSAHVQEVLQKERPTMLVILRLAELHTRAGMEFNVSTKLIASACQSSSQAFKFLSRYYPHHPNDDESL
jgi:hypothetical protein